MHIYICSCSRPTVAATAAIAEMTDELMTRAAKTIVFV